MAGGKAMPMLALALTGVLILALCFVRTPAMVDYVNHLARMYLLAQPHISHAYVVTWLPYPNLAMDLAVPALARLLPVDVAARIFLALVYGLVVSGAMAVERVVKGRDGFAGLCAVLVLFSVPFAWGLINFCFGLGVALWGFAAWLAARDCPLWQRWLLHCITVLLLFVSHFFALGLYGVMIGLVEFPALLALGPAALQPGLAVADSNAVAPDLPGRLRRAGLMAALMASPLLVLLFFMRAAGGTIGGQGTDWDFASKAKWPFLFFNLDSPAVATISFLVIVLLVAWAAVHRRLQLDREGAWIAAGLLLLYLALPRQLFDIAYLDVRVLAAAMLVLPAFMHVRVSWRVVLPLAVLAVLNGAMMLAGWQAHARDYDQFRASFNKLEGGTAVLTALAPISSRTDAALYYAPTLSAPAADMFVPSLYALRGVQPLAPVPEFADLALARGLDALPIPLAKLINGRHLPRHARDWRRRYRYLYVIGAPGSAPLPGTLLEIARGDRFRLYQIVPPRKPR